MLPTRWGVAFALVFIASGVALVIVGSRALDGAADRRSAALYAGFIVTRASSSHGDAIASQASTASDEQTWSTFANSSGFAVATDGPVFASFYLWNLTNSQELLNGDTNQPKLQQIGPYTYEQRAVKRDVRLDTMDGVFGTVSYRVKTDYTFVPERSNGSEMDSVVTVNASYVKRLSKMRARGYSERFLVAEYAHRHLREYTRHLRGEFIAQTKQRALRSFLPDLVANARAEALPAVISRQRARVVSSNIPSGLVKMAALARTEQIPFVLRDVYKNISDGLIPGFLAKSYAQAKVDALPRVLSNMFERLQVESVPSLLQNQLNYQRLVHVPRTLSSLWLHLERIAFPYVMSEVFDRACLEAVPFVLRSIKNEIIARNIANNRVTADEAQLDAVELWRLRSSQLTDFDAWIDDSPTGSPRTGFELLPTDSTLQLSSEVAMLLLGSKSSNLRFSVVDYDDTQSAAALAMDTPSSTPEGFAIWKQVIAMNETAIAYVLEGVNNDVALTTDYLTRAQLLYVRDYLMMWASSAIVQRDRQRFWRAPFARRTSNSDVYDPDVDLDYEQTGTQSGFSLVSVGASSSVTTSVARQLWNMSAPLSIVTAAGFAKWLDVIDTSGSSTATQVLLDGVTGITSAQVTEVTSWIASILSDGFIARRALRHWSDGTCQSVLKLNLSSCLRYDLEPLIPGDQLGFEMNPSSEPNISVSQATRELLWKVTTPTSGPPISFLVSTHPSDATSGFGLWMRAIRTSNVSTLVDSVQRSDFTDESASAIADWLNEWASTNSLNALVVHNWWSTSVCWPRVTLSVTSVNTVISTSQPTCGALYEETEVSSVVTATGEASPFATFEKTYQVDQTECEFDSSTSTYTSNHTTYSTDVREYSCDAISTSLADDEDELTFGFELSLLVTSTSDRVPIAAALELWEKTSTLSFLNLTGFHRWFRLTDEEEDQAIVADTAATILTELNERVATICADGNVGGGDKHSAIFNSSISDAACSSVTSDHVEKIASWVRSQLKSHWIRNKLLDQWRRGSANTFDVEPYRHGQQTGLELECGCAGAAGGCALSSENGTTYVIPREAMQLWDADANSASFLTYLGASLWEQLSLANATGVSTAILTAQSAIVSASGIAQWELWMDRVLEWLESWKQNEHLVRDVVSHWLYAQCPTAPATLEIISEAAPVTSTHATCPSGGASEYSIQLNDTVLELQDTASRPTRFFDAEVVDNAARVQPRKVVEATESWISCEKQAGVSPTAYTETIVVVNNVKEYQACNVLRVLASTPIASLPVSPIDDLFELNSSNTSDVLVTTPDISIPVAVRLWESSSDFSVANERSFVDKWFFAIDGTEQLHSVEDELNALVDESEASNLTAMQQYLVRWESSELMAEKMGEAWLSTAVPLQDLDPSTDGIQSGLELRSSRDYIAATTGEAMPTLAQTKHLWNAKNQFSFLHIGDVSDSGLPVGFNAWKELYEGVDFSSEQLVDQYPLKPVVDRKNTMSYTLTAEQRNDLLDEVMADTSLTAAQIRGIAGWVLTWSNRLVLQDFVLFQWATGKTPRGSSAGRLNLADHLKRLYNFTDSGVSISASNRDDYFTVDSELLSSMSKPKLRSLWSLNTNGSLVNPASRVLWCTVVRGESDLNTQVSKYCPHILDDFGAVTEAALEGCRAIVKPALPQVTVSRSSNLTQLALAYFQMKFALDDEQTLVIADWWRSRQVDSLFYQVDQLEQWTASEPLPQSALRDPLRNFGFGLALVFPWGNESVSRAAASSDLVSNMVVLPSDESSHSVGECSLSLEVLLTLWNESNGASFLNSNSGVRAWLKFAQYGDEAELLQYMNTAATTTGNNDTLTVIEAQQLSADDISCTLQSVAHWVRSWYNHPWLRAFVELLWVEPLAGSSTFFLDQVPDPTDLIAPFRLLPDPESAIAITNTSWQLLARLVLDPVENVSVVNPYEGYSLWNAQLLACADSDKETAKCSPAKDDEVQASGNKTAFAALNVLKAMVSQQFGDLGAEPDASLLAVMIQEAVVPWVISLLDSDALQEFILEHLQAVQDQESSASVPVSLSSIGELAAVQFVNGSVTRMNFSLVHRDEAYTDVGRISERVACEDVAFVAQHDGGGTVQVTNISFTPGFGELRAFCAENARDAVFAYDHETENCGLQAEEYFLTPNDVATLWRVFSDDTVELPWPTNTTIADEIARYNGFPLVSPLGNTARVALLIDAFLAQPFASLTDCSFVMTGLAVAYADSLTAQQIDAACVEQSSGGVIEVVLDLPMLADAGFADKPRSFTTDFQAYLRYAATKFVYEPHVLGRTPTPLDLDAPLPPSGSKDVPLGGVIARTTVVRALFGSDDSSLPNAEALGIDGAARTVPGHQELPITLRLPLQHDMEAYTQRSKAVGEVLTVNGSDAINIWGMKVPLSGLGATDGSQFTTAVFTGRMLGLAGRREFPPLTLLFYWPKARRLVTLEYSRNITRFGATLMRYCVTDWTAPSTVPTGVVLVDEMQTLTVEGINMSYIADELPLVLQAADVSTETVIDVDPVTGLVYHRRFVWQVAAVFSRVRERDGGVWHTQLAPLSLPVTWVNEEASASPSNAMSLAKVAHPGPFATEKVAWWGVIGGSAYIALGATLSYVSIRRTRVARVRRFQSVTPASSSPPAVNGSTPGKAVDDTTSVSGRRQVTSLQAVNELLEETEGVVEV